MRLVMAFGVWAMEAVAAGRAVSHSTWRPTDEYFQLLNISVVMREQWIGVHAKLLRPALRWDKKNWMQARIEDIARQAEKSNLRPLWALVRALRARKGHVRRPIVMTMQDGSVVQTVEDQAHAWRQHHTSL